MYEKPKISVVMSVYNADRYLREAIKSIREQTIQEWELIIVNDGSTDTTKEILDELCEKDARIRILNWENRGLAASLNEAIDAAKGRWIARMDADDVSLKNRLKTQLNWLDHTGADICGGSIRLFGTFTKRTRRYPVSDDAIKLQLCLRTAFAHPAVMMRTSLARAFRYNQKLKQGQDYDLWTRFAMSGARMTNVQKRVLHYRLHSKQVSEINYDKQVSNRLTSQKKYIEYMIGIDGAFEIMQKFSSPRQEPNEEDAVALMDIMKHVEWASPRARLDTFAVAMRYVRPSSYKIYRLYEMMRKELRLKKNVASVPLWAQAVLGVSANTPFYNFLKRFI